MDFKSATDEAISTCITLADIAESCGVSHNTIRRARMARSSKGSRSPPPAWEASLVALLRERAENILSLAEELKP